MKIWHTLRWRLERSAATREGWWAVNAARWPQPWIWHELDSMLDDEDTEPDPRYEVR
jgi:hypothetical protein